MRSGERLSLEQERARVSADRRYDRISSLCILSRIIRPAQEVPRIYMHLHFLP